MGCSIAYRLTMLSVVAASAVTPLNAICSGARSFCERLPDPSDTKTAIFVGKVQEASNATALFEVAEAFFNVRPGNFSVRLTSDNYLGGRPVGGLALRIGQIWLVEAILDARSGDWITGPCFRTKPDDQSVDDVRVLRTWARGGRERGRVVGEVYNPSIKKAVPGATVYLNGDNNKSSTTTDENGQFAFNNLMPAVYIVGTRLPGWGEPALRVDLTSAWCSPHIALMPNLK